MQTKIYEETMPVSLEWLDYKKEMKLSSLFRVFQDVSLHQLENLSLGDSFIREKGLHWVVSRYHAEIKRMPRYKEKITVRTYPGPILAFFFPRHYEVLDESGTILIKAGSLWALVDEKKRTMVRPSDYNIQDIGIVTGNELHYPLPYKTVEGSTKGFIKATYSYCDLNGHLNNCAYFDALEDLIPIAYLTTHSPKTIDIHYKKEIVIGEEIPLSYEEKDDLYTFHCNNFSLGILFQNENAPQSINS